MTRAIGILLVGLAAVMGCGETKTTAGNESGKDSLIELGLALKSVTEGGQKPPAQLAQFDQIEPMLPLAGPMIRDGEIVYQWGAPYAAGSAKVIAYEKKATTEGGWVLCQDGTVKQMTADELKAAPKPGK